jgi:hypothetical protein
MLEADTLETLKKLEDFRIKMDKGEIKEGCADWVVRCCQAIIAKGHFDTRREWTEILNNINNMEV